MNRLNWFETWGITEDGGPSEDPIPGVKVFESDITACDLTFGARICALWLRFIACHQNLNEVSKEIIAADLGVEVGTLHRWIKELGEAGKLAGFEGTWLSKESEGFVYFVQSIHGGPIKIGFATDPQRRLAQLQTGHPEQLKIIKIVKGNRQLEVRIHQLLASIRIHGEWFLPNVKLFSLIENIDEIARQ